MILRVTGFYKIRTKRIIKRAKLYYMDTGLQSHLMGFLTPTEIKNGKYFGILFETLVLHHLRVALDLLSTPGRIYHWRTINGKEVDFVLEWGRNVLPVEVKAKENVNFTDFENIQLFFKEYSEAKVFVFN